MSITNIGQNRVEQPANSVASKKNAVGKKDSDDLKSQGNSQVTLNKMSQVLGSNEKKSAGLEDKENLSNSNFPSNGMMQAQSGNITPEFVASLLDRNPYTST